MLSTHHHWLPVIIAVFLPVSFIITYSIAVANDHVKPGFPYISDTGTFPPESCVFGQLLNIGAVLCGIIIYIRYRHVETLFRSSQRMRSLLRLNTAAFITGLLTVLGVSMVGNFQETSVIVVHLLGAFMAFAVGFVYCVLQTVMSYKMNDEMPGNSILIRRFRVALCLIDVILLIVLGVVARIASDEGPEDRDGRMQWTSDDPVTVATITAGSKGPGDGIEHYNWTADDPGYVEHLVSTVSEWLIAIADVLYFATFYKEFKLFRVLPPKIVYYDSETAKESLPNLNVNPKAFSHSLPS